MASKKKNKKTVNIRSYRYHNINIGVIFFFVVMIYVLFNVFHYFNSSHIVRYEVKEGSLATDNTYTGIILRKEKTYPLDKSGYILYFAGEGERVALGDLVYTVDETGRLNDYLESVNSSENSLSEKELYEFRSEIINYVHGYDSNAYNSVYDFKSSLQNTVLKLANSNILQGINAVNGMEGAANTIKNCYAGGTGIITYWTDGYENLTAEEVTEAVFDRKEYKREQLNGTEMRGEGQIAYKLSTDEEWSLIIPIDPEKGAALQEEDYVKVRFLKNQYESWGQVSLLHNPDQKTYLKITFTNSMVTFVSDRFLDVELITNEDKGLKIPVSSIVRKEFFLVPEDFVCTEEIQGTNGVYKQVFHEDGTSSVDLIEMEFYNYDAENKMYYLDTGVLNVGDIIHKNNSQETFVISQHANLIGVYNVNKGYADFKQISILYQNDEYAIVKPNTEYGLRVYDYIVLNADTVYEDQFVNK